jgi:hypothetical protein
LEAAINPQDPPELINRFKKMSFGFGGGFNPGYNTGYVGGMGMGMGLGVGSYTPYYTTMHPSALQTASMINDMQLRQYIDQVFMRYDFNRTGTLNLQELHMFLNELFSLCGIMHTVSYGDAYNALMAMDANRDGQINKYELFNLFRYMTQPNYTPIGYSYGNRSFGLGGVGTGFGGGIAPYGGSYSSTTTTTTYPGTTYTTYGTGMGGVGGMGGGWSTAWGGW